MTAYYNEKDHDAAEWLRDLIAEGHIAPGDVDERSIVDVRSADLDGFQQCHFFAGIGGWPLALRFIGWPDSDPVWTGSCPCQPFSAAGKRKGFDDARHLWPEFRRLIAERRPSTVFGEQVARAADWLRLVRSDLEALEYAVGAMPIEAASAGADHLRDRFWFVADDGSGRCAGSSGREGQFEGRAEAERAGNPNLGYAGGERLAVGSVAEIERGNLREEGPSSPAAGDRGCAVPDAERQRVRGEGPGAPSGTPCGVQGADGQRKRLRPDAGTVCDAGSVDMAEPERDGARCGSGSGAGPQAVPERKHWRASGAGFAPGIDGEAHEWVLGADGKARRVKPGVRLLAHALPRSMAALGPELEGLARLAGLHRQSLARAKSARVNSLRGFGNAIDPRPAAAFITAAMQLSR